MGIRHYDSRTTGEAAEDRALDRRDYIAGYEVPTEPSFIRNDTHRIGGHIQASRAGRFISCTCTEFVVGRQCAHKREFEQAA